MYARSCGLGPGLRFLTSGSRAKGAQRAARISKSQVERTTQRLPNRNNLHDADGRLLLKNLAYEELVDWCLSIGERHQRAAQLWRWMYGDNCWAAAMEDTVDKQNGLSAAFCSSMRGVASIDGGLRLQREALAEDGTRKLVFELTSGRAAGRTIETVMIPSFHTASQRARTTVCVSSQVGCAMNCQFCLTGRMGLQGQLSTAQIVEQVVAARRIVASSAGVLAPVANVVFMGMGEPLANLDAVVAAVSVLTRADGGGLALSPNKVTVSTAGLVPEMTRLVSDTSAALAVSLHATTDEVRDWLVPVNRHYNLACLVGALEDMFPSEEAAAGIGPSSSAAAAAPAAPLRRRRRRRQGLLVEYLLLAGVNDTDDDAARLAAMLSRVECKVNLITFNPHPGTPFRASSPQRTAAFRDALLRAGIVATLRDSRGDDQMAACGQLAGTPPARRGSAGALAPAQRAAASAASLEGGHAGQEAGPGTGQGLDLGPETWVVPLSPIPETFRKALVGSTGGE